MLRAIVRSIAAMSCALLLLLEVECARRNPAPRDHKHLTQIPARCVNITHFDKPCQPDGKGGYVCDGVHYKIRPDRPECLEYDTANVLTVNK
jgi:hypothetical protein